MGILNVKTSTKVNTTLALEDTTVARINAYAAYVKGTPDAVVEAALSYVFNKDKEFSEYEKKNPDVPQLLTVTASENAPTGRRPRARRTDAA
jgi:hypothetical protein